jgi:hypothetical protein
LEGTVSNHSLMKSPFFEGLAILSSYSYSNKTIESHKKKSIVSKVPESLLLKPQNIK